MTGNNGSCIRFGSINLNNTLQTSEGDERLFREIYRRGIQALALQEVGCNWSIMGRHQALQQRLNDTFGPYDTRAIVRHNVHDLTGTSRQWGGTGIILKGKIKHYNKGSGGDPTGLGRWTWIRLQGKGGVVFRYVSIYCPCKNKDGVLTVWSQHKVYLQSNNDDRDPCDAFLEDLRTHIEQWVKEGDQILIGGDLNHQVLSRKVIELFGEFHMKNLIFERHSTHNAPSTYYLHEEGRIVDGLWGTPGLVATRCGYLRPETFPGNHSLLWADISYQSALGHIPPRPNTPAARRLQLSIPSCVDRYLQSYTTQIQILDLPKRQFYLESTTKPNHPLSPSQKQEAEAIDYLKTGCMNRAEKHCRKLRMGEVCFSEATMLPLRRIIWWNIAIRRRQGGRVQPSLWQRRKREAGMRDLRTSTLSLAEMQTLRRQAVKDYRTAKRQHVDHRQQHLMKLPKKIRKRLRKVEEQRRLGKMAKSVTGKLASKSIIMVEHEGKEYFTKEEIEEVLLQVNENKVRASEETPFMQDPLTRDFGYGIESQEHDRVLEGTYIAPPECDQATALLIQGLKKPESFYTMQEALPRTRITTADHVKGWKKQKERTAGGLSGLHFGHYKAHIRVPLLADFDASMRSVAYTTGYSYKRWQKGVDVQLMKKSGDHRATGLRTILLIEPDHNMNNKMLGKDTMRMGEKMTELARDNYGGRKGLRAVEVSMNQLLTFNSIWARRGRAIIMSNDAKGCYDRIAHTVVNLALQRLGAPRPALQSMITTIQAMEHYVQTSFGVSSKAYNIDRSRPPVQGILQGNGAGPAGWSAIAAVIINAMKKQGFGHSSWSLIRRRALTLVCFAFVDDTDIIHSHPDRSIPTSQVIEQAQKALTLWENLLRATGGALAPEKSYWYLVEVARVNGKWSYVRKAQQPYELTLEGGVVTNSRLEVYQARKALGIMIRPDGKMTDQVKHLKQKVTLWCDGVRTKKLRPMEAWYSLKATIMKSLEYPLMATTLSRNQCKDIMRPLLRTALPLCKLQRNFPRALVHGTLATRGIDLPDLYWLQLVHHVQSILRHMHRDNPTRDLHEENMDLIQFHVGSTVNFWELPYEEYGALAPDGWMKHTWEALSLTSLSLRGPSIGLKYDRCGDIALMDAFVAQKLDDKTLIKLNECRLYLGASMLSHISTACGLYIDERCWNGRHARAETRPTLIHTHKPNHDQWKVWRQALQATFLAEGATGLKLRAPLGEWLNEESPTWKWWMHHPSATLYERMEDGTWNKWSRVPRRYHQRKFRSPVSINLDSIPFGVVRASVVCPQRSELVSVVGTGKSVAAPQQTQAPHTISEVIQQLPDSARWALKNTQIRDEGAHVAEAIRNGSALAVSDGSLKMEIGTAAFVIEGSDFNNRIRGVNQVPGPIKEGDSLRCELAGLYAIVKLVEVICKIHKVCEGRITVCCDNLAALRVFDDNFLPDPNQENFDLICACWATKNLMPIRWNAEHVKGHQDEFQPRSSLSRQSLLNIEMDAAAKAFWTHITTSTQRFPRPKQHAIEGEEWQIWRGNHKVTHPSAKKLYSAMQDSQTTMWWIRNEHMRPDIQPIIDYDATKAAMQGLPTNHRHYVTKMASANCGVGTTLVEWKYHDNAKCPRCAEPQETTAHVLQCKGNGADEVFEAKLNAIDKYLLNEMTRPDLHEAIVHCIQRWRLSQPIALSKLNPDVRKVVIQQHSIGWQPFTECLPAKGWQRLQRIYLTEQGLVKSSRKWIKGLLTRLHYLNHGMWLHRCHVKASVTKPQEVEHIQLLHELISNEFTQGEDALLPGDKTLLQCNILHLLQRPLSYKKGWIIRIQAARQRYLRIQSRQEDLMVRTKEASRLFQWLAMHRTDTMRTNNKRKRGVIDDNPSEKESEDGGATVLEKTVIECDSPLLKKSRRLPQYSGTSLHQLYHAYQEGDPDNAADRLPI